MTTYSQRAPFYNAISTTIQRVCSKDTAVLRRLKFRCSTQGVPLSSVIHQLITAENASPNETAWDRNEDDLIGALRNDEMPALVNASNRHRCVASAIRINGVTAGNRSARNDHAPQVHVIHSGDASVALEGNLACIRKRHKAAHSREPSCSGREEAMRCIAVRLVAESV